MCLPWLFLFCQMNTNHISRQCFCIDGNYYYVNIKGRASSSDKDGWRRHRGSFDWSQKRCRRRKEGNSGRNMWVRKKDGMWWSMACDEGWYGNVNDHLAENGWCEGWWQRWVKLSEKGEGYILCFWWDKIRFINRRDGDSSIKRESSKMGRWRGMTTRKWKGGWRERW